MKRQQESVSSDDVIILDSPFMSEDRLLVLFVVGGHGDQSEPVSESVLTNLLPTQGPRLATALTIAVSVLPDATHFNLHNPLATSKLSMV